MRDLAEAGQVQFKERIASTDDKYEISCEMVAFSNSRGGRLIIGINDKSGEINVLSYQERKHSTAIEGSTDTEIENQLLFDEGIAAKGRSLTELIMNFLEEL